MKRRPVLVIMLVALASLLPIHRASATIPARLVAVPLDGHSGDVIYLSGAGFPANRQLDIRYVCSNNTSITLPTAAGPRTDSRGHFMAYSLKINGPPEKCTLSATSQAGSKVTVNHTLLGPSQPLPPCSAHMCLKLTAVLVRVNAGAQGNVTITGWPGAQVNVVVNRDGAASQHKQIRLGWQGGGIVHFLVAPGFKKGLKAGASAQARLGTITGSGSQQFSLFPGGR